MCGLAGMALIGGDRLPGYAQELLERMSGAVAHRGPDGANVLLDGPVALAFRRLALVGAAAGDQPLYSADRSVVLIANGEVYNHAELADRHGMKLRTTSDCEVLAHLYAVEETRFLDGVNGMFALIIWDRKRNHLVFARDRFGIKPLYYARVGDMVLFASEIKALMEHPQCPRALDWDAALADQMLTSAPHMSHDPVNTWFRGIEIVPAGAVVTVDLATGRTTQRAYWELPDFAGDCDASDEEFIRAYREILEGSVIDCASADTELGLFLSGGIDSSAVAALATANGRSLHTFSVLSGSTFANGDAEYAHRAARALGVRNHQVLFDLGRAPEPDEWKRLLWLLETPLCGPEQYFKYELHRYAKQARPELRGMLLGQASDEFNGGYSTVIALYEGWPGFDAGVLQLARATVGRNRRDLAGWLSHDDGMLLTDQVLDETGRRLLQDPYSAYVRWKYRDIQQYNCWHEDRTAAGNGVEARVPFLDHRLIELLATIPAKRRPGLLWDKRILRDAVRDMLPAEVADRPKGPFFYGPGERYTYRAFVEMLAKDDCRLLDEALAAPGGREFLRPEAVRAMFRRLAGEAEPADITHLLRLVNLGLLDAMVRSLPRHPVDAPPHEVVGAASVTDWARDARLLAGRLREVAEPDRDDVVAFAEGVVLVQPVSDPQTLYISVDGEFQYVVEAADDPGWAAFLRNVDGRRTLDEVLSAGAIGYEVVAPTFREALEARVLRVEPGADTGRVASARMLVGQ